MSKNLYSHTSSDKLRILKHLRISNYSVSRLDCRYRHGEFKLFWYQHISSSNKYYNFWFNWRGMPILCHKCQWLCCVQPQLLAAAVLQVSRVVLRYANWRPPVLQADERWLQVLSGRQAHWGMQDETQVTQCRPDCKLIFIFIPANL